MLVLMAGCSRVECKRLQIPETHISTASGVFPDQQLSLSSHLLISLPGSPCVSTTEIDFGNYGSPLVYTSGEDVACVNLLIFGLTSSLFERTL